MESPSEIGVGFSLERAGFFGIDYRKAENGLFPYLPRKE
jgi:hypothetical protein